MKKWLVVFGLLLCFVPQVLYAGECGSMIFDQAGKLNIGEQRIENAAKALEQNSGAVVRIHAVSSFGGYASLDGYKNHLRGTCEEFDSGLNGKMILIAISFEPKDLAIFYGDFWASELSSQYKRILKDKTGPGLRKGDATGDYSEAFVDTLREIGKVLDAPAPVVHVPQSSVVREAVRVVPPTVVVQKEATDMSGLWSVLKWALRIGAVFGIGIVMAVFFRNKKKEREARSAAQRKAQSMKMQCVKLINELKLPIARAKSLVSSLAKDVAVGDMTVLTELYAFVEKVYSHEASAYASVPSKMDPDIEDLSVPEYVTIAEAYGEILTSLSDAKAKTNLIVKQVDELKQRVSNAPKRIIAAEQIIADATEGVNLVEKSGYSVLPMRARLKNVDDMLQKAQLALKEHKYADVFAFCDSAVNEAKIASSNATNLPKLHEDLLHQIRINEENIIKAHEVIAVGLGAFSAIAEEYLAAAWMPIRGNGTEAENAVISAMQLTQQAKQFVTMDEQGWKHAQDLIDQSNLLVTKVHSLIHSITELKDNLDTAKANILEEIRNAQTDIEEADAYISMYDVHISDAWWSELDKARESLDTAKVILHDKKPDYVRAMKFAMSANISADNILDQVEDEHETMIRKRQRITTLLLTARQSVSVAEEYYEDHSGDIGSRARSDIRSARSVLDNINSPREETLSGMDGIIRELERTSHIADRGLDAAEDDVSDAQSSISGGSSTWGTMIDTSSTYDWSGGNFGGGSVDTNSMNDWGGGDLGGGSIGFDSGGDLGGGSLEGGW